MATHNNSKPVSRTQDRNRQGDRLGKRGRRDHAHHNVTFSLIYPEGGQWKT